MTFWSELHGEFFRGAKALVTGGAGFIGSHLTEALLRLGARVCVLDDLSGGRKENVEPFRQWAGDRLEFVEGSILDIPLLDRLMGGCRWVFHEAALVSVPGSVKEPEKYAQVNIMGTLAVLESARRHGVERVMFAASSSAYGETATLPKREDIPPAPCSPYAASKVAGEMLMQAWAASYGLDTVSLRYFNIFGPRQDPHSPYAAVIAAFAKALLTGQRPVIFGDGEQSRDFTYVDNVVHANLLAARRERPLHGVVLNVGCGRRISVNELAMTMVEMLGRPDLKPVYQPPRPGDVRHSWADLSRIEQELGYRPVVDFHRGLEATLAWYAQALVQP